MLSSTQALLAFEQVTLAGRTFRLRQLKLSEWADLQSWLKTACPSPVAVALKELAKLRSEGLPIPADVQEALFRQAQDDARRWPPRIGTSAWFRSLDGVDGGRAQFLLAAVKPSGETLTEAEAEDIMERSTGDEEAELIRVILWGDHSIPKAETPSEKIQRKILGAGMATNGDHSSSESENSGQPGPMPTLQT